MSRALQFAKYLAIRVRDKAVVGSQKRYALFWPYIRVEMKPPTLKDLPEVLARLRSMKQTFSSGNYKKLTVKESFQNMLVCFEIYCWFLLGECIGRGALPGYVLNIGPAYGTDFGVYNIVYSKKPFEKNRDYSDLD